jgi:hypothetical protein
LRNGGGQASSFSFAEATLSDYHPIDPTRQGPMELPEKFWNQDLIIRVVLVPQTCPRLNSDALRIIFEFLTESCDSSRIRQEEVARVCLTCREWQREARLFFPFQDLLGVGRVYPNLVERIDFEKKKIIVTDSRLKEFSVGDWINYGRDFLDIFSRIPGTSKLTRIDFGRCFTTFSPSEWARCFLRCFQLREFSFQSQECAWTDISDFLITLQSSRSVHVVLHELVLHDISSRDRHDFRMNQNQTIKVETLDISRIHSTDTFYAILSQISRRHLEIVRFDRTSYSIESAEIIIDFLSSLDTINLREIQCSFMPPDLNKYLSSPSFPPIHDSLVWSLPDHWHNRITRFAFNGLVFGTSSIRALEISTFSRMPHLKYLCLKYCLDDVYPSYSFDAMGHLNDESNTQWSSLEVLDITYEFGDMNWERGAIDEFSDRLTNLVGADRQDTYECVSIKIPRREGDRQWSLEIFIRKGGNESYD